MMNPISAATLAVMTTSILLATPAAAAPSVGDTCLESQGNKTTVAANGTTLRCLADDTHGWLWRVDTGKKPESTWIGAQRAWAACKTQGYTDAQCRDKLNR